MTKKTAQRIIEFFANLQGMERLPLSDEQSENAVIDLNSGAIIKEDPECPHGEVLIYERPNGIIIRVHTCKLMEQFFVRHAYQISIMEGGSAKDHYKIISDHFRVKTGYVHDAPKR